MLGTMSALYIVLADLSYPILLSVYVWFSDKEPIAYTDPEFDHFSTAYTAIILYFILVGVSSKRNLGVFVRLGSLGAIFVTIFVMAIIVLSAYSWLNTDYQIGTTAENKSTKWQDIRGVRTIVLFTYNFAPLASILSHGFYLHTFAVPILRNAKKPEHNTRNLGVGFLIVSITYIIIGALGYISFISVTF